MGLPPSAALAIVSTLLLAGCAAEGTYPSLKPRALEAELAAGDPEPVVPIAADDPGIAAGSGALVSTAREADETFQRALAAAQRAVSRAGAAASESWVEAQQELSRAEAARAATVSALAELDSYVLAQVGGDPPPSAADVARLEADVARGLEITERQQAQLDRLRASLRPI